MAGKVRRATHAGSWYSDDEERLSLELDRWLDLVPAAAPCIGPASSMEGEPEARFPTEGARVIIAPYVRRHAGYAYSGKAAAWAYKALDMSKAGFKGSIAKLRSIQFSLTPAPKSKRIFILGPSHHHYLPRCALSACTAYATPCGELRLDLDTIGALQRTGKFETMSQSVDEDEHSIEMHLPYIHKLISLTFSDYATTRPPIVPILVGSTSPAAEKEYGRLLAPYLADEANVFVISSDFAHWGARFGYTHYRPAGGAPPFDLRPGAPAPQRPRLHECIAAVDMVCVAAVEGGMHDEFLEVLAETGNTVCGRHPIGVAMAAVEVLRAQRQAAGGPSSPDHGCFRFVRYERSSDCVGVRDSSVSYCSAFAVL